MESHAAIKKISKLIRLLLRLFVIMVIILILIIVAIALLNRDMRINGFKEFYPKAFQLIEEKYDNNIYLSDRRHGSIILEFTAKHDFENTYNTNDLPEQEFYTLVGHEIFDCFKDELTREMNRSNYFSFPVCITIKYGKSSDEYIYLELYEKDWSE